MELKSAWVNIMDGGAMLRVDIGFHVGMIRRPLIFWNISDTSDLGIGNYKSTSIHISCSMSVQFSIQYLVFSI